MRTNQFENMTPQEDIECLVQTLLLQSEFESTNEVLGAGATLGILAEKLRSSLNADSPNYVDDGLRHQIIRLQVQALEKVLGNAPFVHLNALGAIRDGVMPDKLTGEDTHPKMELLAA